MKKLSLHQKLRLMHSARRELGKKTRADKGKEYGETHSDAFLSNPRHPHEVEAWAGNESETVISETLPFIPPRRLCFVENWNETLDLLSDVQKVSAYPNISNTNSRPRSWYKRNRTSKGLRRIKSYFDFAKIEFISTAVALAFTAEYDIAKTHAATPPPTINLNDWHPEVLLTLAQMGFFETLGIIPETAKIVDLSKEKRVLKIVKGTSGDQLQNIAKAISELVEFWDEGELDRKMRINLNTAIGEAMINVAKWAYDEPRGLYDDRLRCFWITGSVDKRTNELVVVIFDRGVGIPETYQRKKLHQNLLKQLSAALKPTEGFEFVNDATYIKNALKYGNSRSDQPERGKGLPQMQEIIEKTKSGSLTIASRGGLYRYDTISGVTEKVAKRSVNGTLIEWRISLPEVTKNAE
ncbi:hypothetical protein [Hoeflea sp.]|uniref:hypothetical protein n=1 Tax=Hoeflea sp. TaxID=1940281 RepID=UPI003A926FA9